MDDKRRLQVSTGHHNSLTRRQALWPLFLSNSLTFFQYPDPTSAMYGTVDTSAAQSAR